MSTGASPYAWSFGNPGHLDLANLAARRGTGSGAGNCSQVGTQKSSDQIEELLLGQGLLLSPK